MRGRFNKGWRTTRLLCLDTATALMLKTRNIVKVRRTPCWNIVFMAVKVAFGVAIDTVVHSSHRLRTKLRMDMVVFVKPRA